MDHRCEVIISPRHCQESVLGRVGTKLAAPYVRGGLRRRLVPRHLTSKPSKIEVPRHHTAKSLRDRPACTLNFYMVKACSIHTSGYKPADTTEIAALHASCKSEDDPCAAKAPICTDIITSPDHAARKSIPRLYKSLPRPVIAVGNGQF